jgi:phosphoribosylaminoimidazolecarboxamide formyltransferase/IMP cyclohydrolase
VVAAPDFEPAALAALRAKKNLRVLRLPGLARLADLSGEPFLDVKSLNDGGMVLQFSFRNRILSPDDFLPASAESGGVAVLARKPTPKEAEDLLFAWAVEAGVTSNSVIFAKDGATVAIGTGEQDRVGCVELTIHKAHTKYADRLSFAEPGCPVRARKEGEADADAKTLLDDVRRRAAEAGAV